MTAPQTLRRTARAVLLIGGARMIAIVWPILLTGQLGIAFYGRFAIVIAVSTLITVPLDAYYLVRAPRTDEADFARDQASRVWTGGLLTVLGLAVWIFGSVAGFSVTKAGLDMMFNARKSWAIRNSRPDRALGEDAIRQATSLAACAVMLAATDARSLTAVGVCYLVGYLPFVAAGVRTVLGVRPRLPERTRITGFLTTEASLGVLYLQGDVILLGWLLTDTQVGYYSLASQVAQTAGLIGQSFAATYHDRLREHDGAAAAGPKITHTWIGAGVCAAGVLGGGLVLMAAGAPRGLWLTFVVFAAVAAARFCSAVFTTVLALQSRDLYRLVLSCAALGVKVVGILALFTLGSPGAALGFVAGELVVVAAPQRMLYRPVATRAVTA
jgi:hypothetical protein